MIIKKFLDYEKKSKSIFLIDAKNYSLGRLASLIANFFNKNRHYNKYNYTSNIYITNFSKTVVLGSFNKKEYFFSTQRVGALKKKTLLNVNKKTPSMILDQAIKCMINTGKFKSSLIKQIHFLKEEELITKY